MTVFRRSALLVGALLAASAIDSASAQNRNDRNDRESRNTRGSRTSRNSEWATRLDTTVTVERGTIVDLSANDGRITVRGWDRSEVEIRAHSESGELQFSKSGRSVRLEARRGTRTRTLDATIDVRVPLNTRVVVGTMLGDVQVLDVRGEVDATLQSGSVTIRGASGRTAVSNVTGDITLSDVDGSVRVSAISGDISLADIRGDVELISNSGDVSLRNLQSNAVQAEVTQGDIFYDGAFSRTGRYTFSTHSGDVHLFLPDSTKGSINMQSFSGSLHSTIPLTLQPGSSSTRASSLPVKQLHSLATSLAQQQRLDIGGGNGAHVSISTFNGDVHISRGPRRADRK